MVSFQKRSACAASPANRLSREKAAPRRASISSKPAAPQVDRVTGCAQPLFDELGHAGLVLHHQNAHAMHLVFGAYAAWLDYGIEF